MAPDTISEKDAQAALQELDTRLHRLRGETGAHGLATAQQLQEIEIGLQQLTDRLAEIEDQARLERSQSLLADVRDWGDIVASLSLPAASAEVQTFTQKLAEDKVGAWKKQAENLGSAAGADDLFDALMQTSAIEIEFLGHEGKTPGESAALGDIRLSLRARLIETLSGQPPDPVVLERWRAVLSDRCNSTLAVLPELSLDRAIAYLNITISDVQWHIQNVTTRVGAPRRTHRRLRLKQNRLLAERQERVLQARLEAIFGRRWVGLFERIILLLTLVVLVLIVVEGSFTLSDDALFWVIMADSAICAIFLWEFFVKLALTTDRLRWFRRHFIIDLLPSIPFGLLGLHAADPVRWGRLARLLRLSRLARYLRVIRIAIRFLRFFGFLTRGLDRIARQYSKLLNRNIILYPNRAERLQAYRRERGLAAQLRRLRAGINERWEHLLRSSPAEEQVAVAIARLAPLRTAYENGWGSGDEQRSADALHDETAEALIRNLSRISAHDIKIALGDDLTTRLARIVRLLVRPPFRWFPIIHAVAPRLGEQMSDAEVLAETAPGLAALLRHYHNRWFYFADLYGTISPSQFVDRLGLLLVRSAMRPAYRLTLFGLFLLLTEGLLQLTGISLLEPLRQFLYRFLGLPIVVLGTLCAFVVAAGMWLQRLAKEATEFYENSATAQFLALMENVRTRFLDRDAEIYYQRIIGPERRLHGNGTPREQDSRTFKDKIKLSLLGNHCQGNGTAIFDPIERAVLLHRDSLDGALLVDSDTRTTSQLLGNPALRRARSISARIGDKEERALQRLNLVRQKTFFGGPFLWFNLITHSVSHMTARLIIDYNHNALPLVDLPRAAPEERLRYEAWLRAPKNQHQTTTASERDDLRFPVVTTAFTAIHFLDDDADRDREVAERFGPEVLQRLRGDRTQLIRQVFGTYPLHRYPKEKRMLNLYAFYSSWLAGGRALFLPLFLFWRGVRFVGRLLRWGWRCVAEIRRPEKRIDPADAADADFLTAVRKIDRMRGPIVQAAILLRARLDPEYLGIPLPGQERSSLENADLDADREFLGLDANFERRLDDERARAEADMQRLGKLLDAGLLERLAETAGLEADAFRTREHIRAAATAYLADYEGIRELLSAADILREVYQEAARKQPLPLRPWPFTQTKRRFRQYWKTHGFGDQQTRKAAWRATTHNVWGVAGALRAWSKFGAAAQAKGEKLLAELLRHPGRITETIVTMRTVQTLAVLDVLNYREHVYRLGNYAADGDPRNELLAWSTSAASVSCDH